MSNELSDNLAILRIVIGYLGEKEQFGWWQSSFFTQGSDSFLSPVFGRTQLSAQYHGIRQAASRIHDERIGVGHVYHLFRLPEEFAQGINESFQNQDLSKSIRRVIVNKDAALDYLRTYGNKQIHADVGPIRVGDITSLHDPEVWESIAGYYLNAFGNNQLVFPYFSNI